MRDKTVLVADDNEFIRTLVKAALRPLGCEIVEARDGGEALELATSVDPDAILLDVVMPQMNGFEVLEKLRSERYGISCPIAMLTTAATQADLDHGADAGANAYIVKPFEKDELRETVRRMLGDDS